MPEKISYINQNEKGSKDQDIRNAVEVLNAKEVSEDQKQEAVKYLKAELSHLTSLEDSTIEHVLSNAPPEVRDQLIEHIVSHYELKGKISLQDQRGEMLTIEIANPPIKSRPPHGWVLCYKLVDKMEKGEDGKMHKVDYPEDIKKVVKTNYIKSFIVNKVNMQVGQKRAA